LETTSQSPAASTTNPRLDVYARVTAKIVADLEAATFTWGGPETLATPLGRYAVRCA